MTPEEFRHYGHEVVDWIADYWANLEALPVSPDLRPGEIAARLPERAPETGEDFAAVLADLDRVITPGLTHWQHPAFFGYFPANTSGPSVLGDLVSAGMGVQGMLWSTSPAATEVETVVLDWLADLLDLPARFHSTGTGGGVIQDSASSAALVATLAALHRVSGGAWRRSGVRERYTVYTSTQAHSSIEKAARLAGIGDENVRLVEVDQDFAMRPDALRAALDADRVSGATPALVVATIGTTSTTAIDPLPAIGKICQEYGVWLHVDAAYAGAAAVCPELRWSHAGVEYADSYCFDPHKWLLTGFDCDAFWLADRAELVQTLTVLPEFLRNAATESGEVIDYRDWQVPLGRRFRALKLWFVLRWYGAEGLRAHIRRCVATAQRFAEWVRADERFEVVAPHPFSLVCFRLRGSDGPNEKLLRAVNATGRAFLTHTKVDGRYVLRLAVGAPSTEERHAAATWKLIQATVDTE
ncbi:aminotransferase class V-fold PLP-dependent enzyme [Planosporangium flavigriseum]|uniref:Aromatic-L-amino-acid decarboxylase n=2 Tax=Planosporangium flavigriseum TaxID=373681 RepID=A0A8J3LXJ1_9ACTN|nr:aminotransferase class V-fold PLP-dependent enzyme [Planosporangium flavigriseum]NJC67225.1 aminotransferase class V-fold PLP-dependent enzyme [Planosporangium flavigriseum]GIG75190.1 aromatic-L-amino-acid decarboxylase [Planosporangium flavigriseum]